MAIYIQTGWTSQASLMWLKKQKPNKCMTTFLGREKDNIFQTPMLISGRISGWVIF
jgi:hypothetical protein